MQVIAKALCCLFVGLVVIFGFCEAFMKRQDRAPAVSSSALRANPAFDTKREEPDGRTTALPLSTDVALACASFDPISHPDQVLDIFDYASKKTGTPIDVLFAVWMNETGVVYGSGGSDRCPVAEQLEIRCKVGGSCEHQEALTSLAKRFNWNTEGMLCSCGTATMQENTHNFGGCCGPFQFSPGEVLKQADALALDPMTFCGGAVIAGLDLKRRHDAYGSWELAIQRYYGADVGGVYYLHAYQHWGQIKPYLEDREHPDRLREFLARTAAPRLAWSRKNLEANSTFATSN